MTEQACSAMRRNGYATCKDFLRVFDEDMRGLYQLSFLLTGDPEQGERCFVTGMEDCAKENRVFREWARSWAKRVIVQNAISELQPQPSHSDSSALAATAFSQKNGPIGHFDVDAVLGLPTSSGLSLCCAFWSATGSTSVPCFSIVQLPKFAKLALRRYRSWLSFGRMFSTCMEIASMASGQKRSRRKGSRHEGTCSRSIVRPPVQA